MKVHNFILAFLSLIQTETKQCISLDAHIVYKVRTYFVTAYRGEFRISRVFLDHSLCFFPAGSQIDLKQNSDLFLDNNTENLQKLC